MSQKLRFSIMGSEPIKFRSKMPNFELKSQYLGQGMPRRGDFCVYDVELVHRGLTFKICLSDY